MASILKLYLLLKSTIQAWTVHKIDKMGHVTVGKINFEFLTLINILRVIYEELCGLVLMWESVHMFTFIQVFYLF